MDGAVHGCTGYEFAIGGKGKVTHSHHSRNRQRKAGAKVETGPVDFVD